MRNRLVLVVAATTLASVTACSGSGGGSTDGGATAGGSVGTSAGTGGATASGVTSDAPSTAAVKAPSEQPQQDAQAKITGCVKQGKAVKVTATIKNTSTSAKSYVAAVVVKSGGKGVGGGPLLAPSVKPGATATVNATIPTTAAKVTCEIDRVDSVAGNP